MGKVSLVNLRMEPRLRACSLPPKREPGRRFRSLGHAWQLSGPGLQVGRETREKEEARVSVHVCPYGKNKISHVQENS